MIPLDMKAPVIPRVHINALSFNSFRHLYQKPGHPVVLYGLLENGEEWTLTYLRQVLKDSKFWIRSYGQKRNPQDKRSWSNIGSGADVIRMRFDDYAQCIDNRQAQIEDLYLAKCPIRHTPLAQSDLIKSLSGWLPFQHPVSDLNLWVGPEGHVECLHYDPTDGSLIQLHGTKRIVLFPPNLSSNLYPFPISVHLRHGLRLRCWFSQVTLQNPDLEAFPRLRPILSSPIEVLLSPGELLYIPAGWWHEVTTLGPVAACSINRFWRVYPVSRALLSWQIWRAHLGSIAAIPHTLASLGGALCSAKPQENLMQILRLI